MKDSWVMMRSRQGLRIALAVVVLMLGMAPVGLPILSDAPWRVHPTAQDGAASVAAAAFRYQWGLEPGGETRVERSDDEGATWHRVAAIPAAVQELEAVRGQENVVFARGDGGLWASRDGGESWARSGALPGRITSLAVSHQTPGLVYAGTESAGLQRSDDGGETWHSVGDADLLLGGAGALAVGDVAIHPEDDDIVYASTGVWLGTSTARLAPLGVFVSVDGGREWFVMERAGLNAKLPLELQPVAGSPLTVRVRDADGARTAALVIGTEVRAALTASEPTRRAAAARAIGLAGDPAALPELVAQLDDPDAIVGERIVEALAALDGQQYLPELRELLDSEETLLQSRAAAAVGLLRDQESVSALTGLLRAGDPTVARRAAEALAVVGSPEALDALVEALGSDSSASTRHVTLIGLTEAGQAAVTPLVAALASDDVALRAGATQALGWLKPVAATDALASALDDPEAAVRSEAAWALGELGTEDARAALAAARPRETDASVRSATESALARAEMAQNASDTSPAIAMLRALGQTPPTRWTAFILGVVLALALLFPPPAPMRRHSA